MRDLVAPRIKASQIDRHCCQQLLEMVLANPIYRDVRNSKALVASEMVPSIPHISSTPALSRTPARIRILPNGSMPTCKATMCAAGLLLKT
jgi:hypothetical protein